MAAIKSDSEHQEDIEMSGADNDLKATLEGGEMPNPLSDRYNVVEKKIIRKLDCTIVPMLWVLYLFNYLDRNNISLVPYIAHVL